MKTIVIAMFIGFSMPSPAKGEMITPIEIKASSPVEFKLRKK